MPRLSTSIEIKANRSTVFHLLQDIENYPQYFKYVRNVKIVQREENAVIADIDEEIHGLTQHLQNRFRFFPPGRVEAEQIKGPFQSARAWFFLEETATGTQLNHVAEFDIGHGIVGKLIHRLVADSYAQKRMAEEVVAIKYAAEKRERQVM